MKNLLLFFALFAASIYSKDAVATHLSHGEFNYRCLGNGNYEITLHLFRDCSGVNVGTTATVMFANTCGYGTPTSAALPLINPGGTEISQLCSWDMPNSSCNGGTLPGFQLYTYRKVVNLPACSSWKMSYSLCCRNNSVNLNGGTANSAYLEAEINTNFSPCNSSPVFTSKPIPYVCFGQPVTFNPGVYELDGDSLAYSFDCARTTSALPIAYNAPYTCNNPINGITLDQHTGILNFTPAANGNFVVVVKVEEFERGTGTYKGATYRDYEFVVINCGANTPPFESVGNLTSVTNGTLSAPFVLNVCEGNTTCFDVTFSDIDILDVITLTSNVNAVFPGATVTQTGTNPATASICFTPSFNSPSSTFFHVEAQDANCAGVGAFPLPIGVNIKKSLKAFASTVLCGNQSAQLNVLGGINYTWSSVSGDTINPGVNFSCINCASPIASPSVTTTYAVGGITDAGCPSSDTVVVEVRTTAVFAGNDIAICAGNNISLSAVVTGTTCPSTTTSWIDPSGGTIGTAANQLIPTPASGVYTYQYSDGCGCTLSDALIVTISDAQADAGIDKTTIQGVGIQIGGSANALDGNPYSWSGGSGSGIITSGMASTTVAPLSTTTYTLTVVDVMGLCPNSTDDVTVTVQPPIPQQPLGIEELQENGVMNIAPNPTDGKLTITWAHNQTESADLTIINLLGEVVYADQILVGNGNQATINMDELRSGRYLITLRTKEFAQTKQVIKN